MPIIDVNIDLGQWPTRRAPLDEPPKLIAKLREHDVVEAWVGSFDGVFHKDLTDVNNLLAATAAQNSSVVRLVPFGEINPLLPNWEADLQRCAETHHMRGIRLHPNYHGYTLDNPEFARLLKVAAERNLIVQIAVIMEDARMMHPLLRVSPVDVKPLARLVAETSGLRIVLLNALNTVRGDELFRLLDAGQVFVEISMLEGVAGIENLLKDVSLDRVLFGSHAPSFYFESAILKLRESALSAKHIRTVSFENAHSLYAPV